MTIYFVHVPFTDMQEVGVMTAASHQGVTKMICRSYGPLLCHWYTVVALNISEHMTDVKQTVSEAVSKGKIVNAEG